jgi:hypothetical protein
MKLGGKIKNAIMNTMQKESGHLDLSIKRYKQSKLLVKAENKTKNRKTHSGPRRRRKGRMRLHLPLRARALGR